ncbi:uncharacterized protein VDAG_05656 [Verticillium dahliae VdLs.17]|uniref:Uncharacterized protein n=1 Tax=Verticillium dahliae (strain VdLs.17 / ATCC MYA-4575 / FGSC 10137) TaxID=498257 RepID=G2X674_VERDV|nr:uncharacterized protein VDAG_05656 [Verticillium dahliae VdLs.17]EGY14492.1 hypothetical protein VDAG_05656 [Verticillium dahliae VdLs.17]
MCCPWIETASASLGTVFISLLNTSRPGVPQGRCSSLHLIPEPSHLPDPSRIPQQYSATGVLTEEAITGLKRRCLLGAINQRQMVPPSPSPSPSLSAIQTKAPSYLFAVRPISSPWTAFALPSPDANFVSSSHCFFIPTLRAQIGPILLMRGPAFNDFITLPAGMERNLRSPSAPEWLHMRPAAGPETLAFLVAEVSTWWEAPSKISLNVELEGGSHLRAGISGLAISLRRLPLL